MSSSSTTTESINNEQQPQEQQTPTTPTNDATSSPDVSSPNNTVVEGGGSSSNFADQFDKMLQRYGEDYIKRVVEASKKDSFTIVLRVPTGNKIPDPLEPEKEIDEFDPEKTEKKTYRLRPISPGDYHRAEKLRAKFANEKDPDKVADNQIRIYQFLAYCYLGMPYSDFNRVEDWTQLKLSVDACNHKTLYQPGLSSQR